jgi:uncharacterized membrane protein YfhO
MVDAKKLEEQRLNALTDNHFKLMIVEVTSSLLKDQKLHIVSNIEKQRAATEEKFAERYAILTERINKIEDQSNLNSKNMQKIDSKVEMWINRGIGVWALVVILFSLAEYGAKFMEK